MNPIDEIRAELELLVSKNYSGPESRHEAFIALDIVMTALERYHHLTNADDSE